MIIDLHAHTSPSSDDSELRPEELIQQSMHSGLDGVCFTEHNWHWKAEDIARLSRKYDFPIFHGMEVSSDEGHVLVFGLSEYRFDMYSAEYIRAAVDEAGGAMILAHPYRWRLHHHADMEKMLDIACNESVCSLIDAIEVLNGRSQDRENDFAVRLCQRLGLKGVGGSDAHSISDVSSCATMFEGYIRNTSDLIAALKAGRFQAVDLRRLWPGRVKRL